MGEEKKVNTEFILRSYLPGGQKTYIKSSEDWISVVKSICCSWRGPRFDARYPHVGLQPSITPVLGDPMPSSDL